MVPQEHSSLVAYTTLKVGGPARYLFEVTTLEALQKARSFARQMNVPLLVLGAGSNVLVSDAGFAGVVVINQLMGRDYQRVSETTTLVVCGAGESLDAVVADTVEKGYWGLENLSHIPGTVGATPVQNVGAYGVEVSDRIVAVQAVHLETGEIKTFAPAECQFGYRDSYFKSTAGRAWIITSVTFTLSTAANGAVLGYADLKQFADTHTSVSVQDVRNEIIRIRSSKFPDWHTVGTAGSFFKNPLISSEQLQSILQSYPAMPHFVQPDGRYKIALGWVLDKVCNLKGYTQGAVGLYENQALVLINYGDSAAAIEELVQHVGATVLEKTGITIEPEVRFV